MAISHVATDLGNTGTASEESSTVTLSSITPTSGNLLIFAVNLFNSGRTCATPSGWTLIDSYNASGHTAYWWYKISDGTETSVTTTWTTGTRHSGIVLEYTGNATSSVLAATNQDVSNATTITKTIPSGSVTPAGDGLVIAFFAGEDSRKWDVGNNSLSNSFTLRQDEYNASNAPAVMIGELINTGTTSQSSTLTTTDTGDDNLGFIAAFNEASAGGTEITATTDALTLTEYAASVNAETSINATVDNLTLTTYAATVSTTTNTEINVGVDALALTEYPANVNAETTISATVDSLSLTTYPATVTVGSGTTINASTDALTLTEHPATITAVINVEINATVDTLNLTTYRATIGDGSVVESTGFLPSLNQRGLTRAQLRRRRNQRYRYLKELE